MSGANFLLPCRVNVALTKEGLKFWKEDANSDLKFIETDATARNTYSRVSGRCLCFNCETSFPPGPLFFAFAGEDTALGSFAARGPLTSDVSSQRPQMIPIKWALQTSEDQPYSGRR